MITAFIVVMLLNIALLLWNLVALARFLRTHASIDSQAALEELKALVRLDMYGGFVMLASGTVTMVLGVLLTAAYGNAGTVMLLLALAPFLIVGVAARRVGMQVMNMRCEREYSQQYESICYVWVNRSLPRF